MKVVIILPTYNEKENIGPMLKALDGVRGQMDDDLHVLVVDDHSPDGTAKVVKEAMKTDQRIHLIEGERQGLGAAYIRGMSYAVVQLDADVVFEMDADFSHNPDDVPRLLAALHDGHDFVIGSRYVPGGTIPDEWSLYRKANSIVGNLVARYFAGIYSVRDCTAGFRAIRGSLLREIALSEIKTQGYGFQVSLLYEACLHKARIHEVPVHFVDRTVGESKLGLRDIFEFIVNAGGIRLRGSKTFIKFGLVGVSGVLVNLLSFNLFMYLGLKPLWASPLAIEVSIIWNYIYNNFWTFRERQTKDGVRIKGLKYNLVSVVTLVLSYSTFLLLSHLFPEGDPNLFQIIGIAPAMLANYFLNSYWTFQDR